MTPGAADAPRLPRARILVAVLAIALTALALAGLASLATSTVAAQDAGVGQAIRRVDFRDFTYADSCIGKVQVVEGKGLLDFGPPGSRGSFRVKEVVYGDLTGDGQEEAVVLTLCNGGGSQILSGGSIYTLREGRPVLLGYVEGGDRADGGISQVQIAGGRLVVTRYGTDDGLCCPTFTVTTAYRLDAGRLVEVGAPVKKLLKR